MDRVQALLTRPPNHAILQISGVSVYCNTVSVLFNPAGVLDSSVMNCFFRAFNASQDADGPWIFTTLAHFHILKYQAGIKGGYDLRVRCSQPRPN